MATEACAVCDTDVRIAGGIGDLWSFAFESTQGMTLELVDGSEFFLCFDCMERLPGETEPTATDVERLQAAAAAGELQTDADGGKAGDADGGDADGGDADGGEAGDGEKSIDAADAESIDATTE